MTTASRASRPWTRSGRSSRGAWASTDAAAYRAFLETDPANHATEPAELVRLAQARSTRAFAAAPALVRARCRAPTAR